MKKGERHTSETRAMIGQRLSKRVAQYDAKTEELIDEYPSLTEASRKTGIPISLISEVANCRRNRVQTNGYKFTFA